MPCPDSLDSSGPFLGCCLTIKQLTICACAHKHSNGRLTLQRRSISTRGRRKLERQMRPRLNGRKRCGWRSARPFINICSQSAKPFCFALAPMGIMPLGWLRSPPRPVTFTDYVSGGRLLRHSNGTPVFSHPTAVGHVP